ncbi:MAG: response regulator [Mesorhizobium sp.]|uniref:response regulator transcription factor n=2 Tax=Mesorhizobium TaxID=68287 RepID=UPI000FD58B6F|nr:response regulator [Mesorhizobium sp.]RUX06480.1 response regulator [Mesorhizobium sp. M8A.F.Ca.ET.023.01.1.1]RVD61999.1 response regulator [Mesorhizobium sp. M8A.F.Ca.ET.023.02.2.1]RWC69860.1 MAG: response regulator [Mesorhizobium sp.]RWC78261.1 MAG: response regulator [Mesorhizobium sp.]RWF46495.1 MAG: response regulator [Mesorhizobium sp.]
MATANPIIAIVDDDDSVRRALKRLLFSLSYESIAFSSGEAFLESLEITMPSCVLLDLHMPGLNGLQVIEAMRSRNKNIPVIVITANPQPEMRKRSIAAGAVAYLSKPLGREGMLSAIQSTIADRRSDE